MKPTSIFLYKNKNSKHTLKEIKLCYLKASAELRFLFYMLAL
jgi:hypothetical protein